jgi:hypothetical protein
MELDPTIQYDEQGFPIPRFITAYQPTLCYGGSEEGGWWYTSYEPTGIYLAVGRDEHHEVRERVEALAREAGYTFKDDPVRWDADGVPTRHARGYRSASPEADCITVAEVHQGETYDEQKKSGRPHYE